MPSTRQTSVSTVARSPRSPARVSGGWSWLLILGLLLGQGLGLWHRVQHARQTPPSAPLLVQVSVETRDGASGHDFWSHAAGAADCQLWDQLLLGDLQPAAALVPALPAQSAVQVVAVDPTVATSGTPAFYRARAPPLQA